MAPSSDASLADALNGSMDTTIPIAHQMGVKIVEASPGRAAATMPMAGNGNHFGTMYAGVLFTVAEILGGIVAVSTFDTTRYFPLVKKIEIAFVSMAKSDVRAEVTLDEETVRRVSSEAEAKGKSDFIVDAVVTDSDGTVVATTHGLYQLRAHAR